MDALLLSATRNAGCAVPLRQKYTSTAPSQKRALTAKKWYGYVSLNINMHNINMSMQSAQSTHEIWDELAGSQRLPSDRVEVTHALYIAHCVGFG